MVNMCLKSERRIHHEFTIIVNHCLFAGTNNLPWLEFVKGKENLSHEGRKSGVFMLYCCVSVCH